MRLVLEHRTGQLVGVLQIIGLTDKFGGQPPAVYEGPRSINELLQQVPPKQFSLIASKPRMLLYREIAPPEGLGTFDQRQQ